MPQSTTLAAIATVLVLVACVPAPKQAYTPSQIADVGDIEELMRVQAAKADPLFGIRGQTAFTDEEFAAMTDAAAMLRATAAQLGGRLAEPYGPGFANYAGDLATHAAELSDAATAKKAADAAAALVAMKETCRSCHSDFR